LFHEIHKPLVLLYLKEVKPQAGGAMMRENAYLKKDEHIVPSLGKYWRSTEGQSPLENVTLLVE
jgi:hypothetical protein